MELDASSHALKMLRPVLDSSLRNSFGSAGVLRSKSARMLTNRVRSVQASSASVLYASRPTANGLSSTPIIDQGSQ